MRHENPSVFQRKVKSLFGIMCNWRLLHSLLVRTHLGKNFPTHWNSSALKKEQCNTTLKRFTIKGHQHWRRSFLTKYAISDRPFILAEVCMLFVPASGFYLVFCIWSWAADIKYLPLHCLLASRHSISRAIQSHLEPECLVIHGAENRSNLWLVADFARRSICTTLDKRG
jgi:hypothetical protein